MTPPMTTKGDKSLVERLHAATAHGDQEHRDWLLAAYTAFFAGEPVPAPRGSGRKEKLIRSLTAEVAMLKEALTTCRMFFQHANAQNTRAILAEIDAALQQPVLTQGVGT